MAYLRDKYLKLFLPMPLSHEAYQLIYVCIVIATTLGTRRPGDLVLDT